MCLNSGHSGSLSAPLLIFELSSQSELLLVRSEPGVTLGDSGI